MTAHSPVLGRGALPAIDPFADPSGTRLASETQDPPDETALLRVGSYKPGRHENEYLWRAEGRPGIAVARR